VLLLQIAIIVILLLIFIQDLIGRAVYWFLFPLLAILLIVIRLKCGIPQTNEVVMSITVNIGFLLLQLLLVSVYFSLKNRRWTNITSSLLGWGDVLFLVSIAFYLSALHFFCFYTFSLLAVLLVWLIWQSLAIKKNKKIPLAGLQALFFSLLLATDWWLYPLHLTMDDPLLNLINK
jgi:hypothetical protein